MEMDPEPIQPEQTFCGVSAYQGYYAAEPDVAAADVVFTDCAVTGSDDALHSALAVMKDLWAGLASGINPSVAESGQFASCPLSDAATAHLWIEMCLAHPAIQTLPKILGWSDDSSNAHLDHTIAAAFADQPSELEAPVEVVPDLPPLPSAVQDPLPPNLVVEDLLPPNPGAQVIPPQDPVVSELLPVDECLFLGRMSWEFLRIYATKEYSALRSGVVVDTEKLMDAANEVYCQMYFPHLFGPLPKGELPPLPGMRPAPTPSSTDADGDSDAQVNGAAYQSQEPVYEDIDWFAPPEAADDQEVPQPAHQESPSSPDVTDPADLGCPGLSSATTSRESTESPPTPMLHTMPSCEPLNQRPGKAKPFVRRTATIEEVEDSD